MIALLSDTHGNIAATERALRLLAPFAPERYLHLGDVGGAAIVLAFEGLRVDFLWGNNDYDRSELVAAARRIGACFHETMQIDLPAGRCFASHGHTPAAARAATSGEYDVVLFGHSHVAMNVVRDGIRLVNPGALHRATSYTCALLDPQTLDVRFLTVSKR